MSENEAKNAIKANWEANAPINKGLREIIEPLAEDFCTVITQSISELQPDTKRELLQQAGNVYTLPYGRVGMLPPTLFGDITEESIELKRELTVPLNKTDRTSMAQEYIDWASATIGAEKYAGGAFPTKKTLMKQLKRLKGMEYPLEDWETSARAMQQALIDEPMFNMDQHRTARIVNASIDRDQLNDWSEQVFKPYNEYVLVMSKIVARDSQISCFRDFVQLPVGEYGKEATGTLARTMIYLTDTIKTSHVIDSDLRDRMTGEDRDLLRTYTARTRLDYQPVGEFRIDAIYGVEHTLAEGVLSTAQVVALLTAEKVPGYESHERLVRDLLAGDVIEQFTRMVQPGFIGPITLGGLYIPGILENKNGSLALSKHALDIFSEMRKEYIGQTAAAWALYRESGGTTERPDMLGLVCPAAAPKGALTTVKKAFAAFYE